MKPWRDGAPGLLLLALGSDRASGPRHVWKWRGPIFFWNRRAQRLYGLSPAEALKTAVPGGYSHGFDSRAADRVVVRHGVLQASVNFLQKPFTPNSLAKNVREGLDHN